jgi:YVTN family beta-propeller protein
MNCLRKSLLRMVLVGVACGSYLLTALPAGADVKVYIANFNARTVTVINSGTNTVVNNIAVPHATLGIAASPNGKFVYATEPFHNPLNVISSLTELW